MKHIFILKLVVLILTFSVGSLNIWATTYKSFTGGVEQSSTTISTSNVSSGSVGVISWTGNSCTYSSNRVNIAANGYITFTATSGYNITKIVIVSGSSSDYYGTWTSSPSVTPTSNSGTTTFEGLSANSVTVTTSTAFRCTSTSSISIHYESAGGGSACATPTFSLAAGTYVGAQNVTINTATDGATIHYTTDGTAPTESSDTYSSAISVSSTTTIKAIAVKDGCDDSEVASATYTIIDPVPGYAIDFENALVAYVDWEMSNIGIHTSGLTAAHDGSAWGSNVNESDNAVSTASITTKEKVDYPNVFTCYISKESSNTTSSTWKIQVSSDGNTWNDIASLSTMTQNTWTEFTGNIKSAGYSNVYVRLYYSGSGAKRAVDDISLTTYTPSSIASPTFSVAGGTYKAAQSVTLSAETGTTIYYTTDGSVPTSGSNEYTAAINVSEDMTIKAIANKDGEDSEISTATYVILDIATGTEADPYTVADAYTAIDAGVFLEDVYAAGTVSEIVTAYNSEYGNITYNISSDGTTEGAQLQAYRGKSYNGDNFTSDDDIQVGDEVVVYGTLTKYGSTYEFAAGNQLVSLNRPVTPLIVVSTASLSSFTYEVGSGPSTTKTFTVSGSNLSEDITLTVSGSDYEISLSASSGYASSLVLEEAAGSVETTTVYARLKTGLTAADYNATITLTSTGATNKSVTLSGSVTVPSLAYTVLPFSFDGGRSDIDSEDGLTQSGLDSDYSSSPKLKFKSADDCLILHFNEAPGTLTFDIKGNGSGSDSWAGTFKVQVSSDGSSYEDIATYTALAATDTKTFDDLETSVRYIKWIYVTKTTGNVALGNIGLTKATAPETIELTGTLGGGQYWVSFFSDSRYTLSEGAKAFTMNSSYQLYQLGTDGSVIPANTAVILISDTAAITLTKSDDDSAIAVNGGANILQGSTSPVAKYTISGTPYVLGVYGGELGFYEYTGDGIPAGKAYYEE